MGLCELCGTKEATFTASIEGSELKVCKDCSKFGKIIKKPFKKAIIKKIKPTKTKEVVVEDITKTYGNLIKKAREKLGLKQKELAKRLSEKESLIHNIERRRFKPNIKLAKKMEKLLDIVLIEKVKETQEEKTKSRSGKLTVGDLIKIKFKKK